MTAGLLSVITESHFEVMVSSFYYLNINQRFEQIYTYCGYVYTYVSLRGNLLTHANNITVFLVTFIFINVMQKTLE